jgi:hypothetical protein
MFLIENLALEEMDDLQAEIVQTLLTVFFTGGATWAGAIQSGRVPLFPPPPPLPSALELQDGGGVLLLEDGGKLLLQN